jgi:hypothetical protein
MLHLLSNLHASVQLTRSSSAPRRHSSSYLYASHADLLVFESL